MPPPLEDSAVVAHAEPQGYHERLQALEKREQRLLEKEQFIRDSHCRVYMGREKISVFNLDAEAPYGPLEGPVAVASKDELERTMMRICEVSEVARTMATHMLPVAESRTASKSTKAGAKRKASGVQLEVYKCSHCKKRFDTDVGMHNDCKFHPGNKGVNEEAQRDGVGIDFWADHDEECHGYKEELVDDPDYQGGMIWSCCDQRGDAEGCKTRGHQLWVKKLVKH